MATVGRTVGSVLQQANVAFAAIDKSQDAVSAGVKAGFPVVYGDPSDPIALEHVVKPSTRLIVLTLPDVATNLALLPRVTGYGAEIVARGHNGEDTARLREHGKALAFAPEAEGALIFARVALLTLGFDAARIDRELNAERDRSPRSRHHNPPHRPRRTNVLRLRHVWARRLRLARAARQ